LDEKSNWFGCDILYFVQTKKRDSTNSKQVGDRFLSLFQRKGTIDICLSTKKIEFFCYLKGKSNEIFFNHIARRGNVFEVKKSWKLKNLRAIDIPRENDNVSFLYSGAFRL
jgi:hypothetical protein